MGRDDWKFLLKNARLPGFFLLFWLFSSSIIGLTGTPIGFQRAGALGVGLLLISFTLLRAKELEFQRSTQNYLLRMIYQAIRLNRVAPNVIEKLNAQVRAGRHRETNQSNIEKIQAVFGVTDETIDETHDQIGRSELRLRFAMWVEVIAMVLATLQWGYGDLVFCLLHGKGWATC